MKEMLELFRDAFYQRAYDADFDCNHEKEVHYRWCAEHIDELISAIEREEKREHK